MHAFEFVRLVESQEIYVTLIGDNHVPVSKKIKSHAWNTFVYEQIELL